MSLGKSQGAVSHSPETTGSSHTKEISFVTVLVSPRGVVPESTGNSEVTRLGKGGRPTGNNELLVAPLMIRSAHPRIAEGMHPAARSISPIKRGFSLACSHLGSNDQSLFSIRISFIGESSRFSTECGACAGLHCTKGAFGFTLS